MFRKGLLPVVFILFVISTASIRASLASEESGENVSPSQAQATMASLFGRGAKMPGIPRIDGTIALPSFDSSGMKIDEGSLRTAERGDQRSNSSQ